MRRNFPKLIFVTVFAALFVLSVIVPSKPVAAGTASLANDAAATYKTKCVACHGPTAMKSFDPAKPDADLVQAILKGKKGEKPPAMPEYETKGINEEAAKALVAHMRSIRPAS